MPETNLAGWVGAQAGEGNSKAVRASEYSLPSISATVLARNFVQRRFHVSPELAGVVAFLAGLGNAREVA